MTGAHPLHEQTRRALETLRDLPATREVAGHLERAWTRVPLAVGLGGDDLAARTELINALCGMRVLEARMPGGAPIRLRRGEAARLRARHDDGSEERHALSDRHGDGVAVATNGAEARARLAEREVALAAIDTTLPRLLRSRPTGWWRILLWPFVWWWTRRHRGQLAERATASKALEVSQREVAALDRELAAGTARTRGDHAKYVDTLRALAAARDVVELELELEVSAGPLVEGVEVCELGGLLASLDVVLFVEGGTVRAPGGEVVGSHAELIGKLAAFTEDARALRLARRARDAIALGVAALDDQVTRAEDDFRTRMGNLEAKRIVDPARFIATQFARIRPQIVTSVSVAIEHASVHLGSELAALGETWIIGITGASTSDALKEFVTHIETTATASTQRIADETRRLVIGAAGGAAHDLYGELVSALIPLGLPEELRVSRAAPELPAIEVLPSLATTSIEKLSGQWLGGLFRSFESRRTDVREKTHEKIEQLRELASDELLDVEPALHAAIEQVLALQLVAACAGQAETLELELVTEQASIDAARTRLAPTVERRDRARTVLLELREQIAALEAAQPACAAASSAVTD